MGKLLDMLEKASRGAVQPLGFGGGGRREKVAPMLLLGAVQAGDEAQAKLVLEAGLDAAIVVAKGAKAADLTKSTKALGEAVFGVWQEQAQAEAVEGCEFQVFTSDATPIAALSGEERTNVMQVVPELDDSLLRTIDHLPVDAFLVSLADAESLTVAQLMRLARVRGVTSRWLLVHLRALPSKEELEQFRDAGVGGIVVSVEGQSLEALKACRETLLGLPHEAPDRDKGKGRSFATLPSVVEGPRPSRQAPEPDEDDWDDD
ncbi:MAG: hypothetical protein WD533_05580 [Dehalococcoidia bacterium]